MGIRTQTCTPRHASGRSGKLCCALLAVPLLLLTACANQQGPGIVAAQTITVSSELATDQVINRHLEADPRSARSLPSPRPASVKARIVLQDMFEGHRHPHQRMAARFPVPLRPGKPAATGKPGPSTSAKAHDGQTARPSQPMISSTLGNAKSIPENRLRIYRKLSRPLS